MNTDNFGLYIGVFLFLLIVLKPKLEGWPQFKADQYREKLKSSNLTKIQRNIAASKYYDKVSAIEAFVLFFVFLPAFIAVLLFI